MEQNMVITAELLSGLSTLAMFIGYFIYAGYLFANKTKLNATSWVLMTAGAFTNLILERIYGLSLVAQWPDIADTVLAFGMVLIAVAIGRYQKLNRKDIGLIIWYFILLTAYVGFDTLEKLDVVPAFWVLIVGIITITLSNATGLIEFIPLIRDTFRNNKNERAAAWAWVVWTMSYLYFLGARWYENVDLVNYIHPVLSIILHGAMILLAFGLLRKGTKRPRHTHA